MGYTEEPSQSASQSLVPAKRQRLPDYVTIRELSLTRIIDHRIRLDDTWSKEIVQKTWGDDIASPRDIRTRFFGSTYTNNENQAILAHASGKLVDKFCNDCKDATPFTECRLNAVWPPTRACTNCAYRGRPCSFTTNDHDVHKKYFPEQYGIRTVATDINTSMRDVTAAAEKLGEAGKGLESLPADQRKAMNEAQELMSKALTKLLEVAISSRRDERNN